MVRYVSAKDRGKLKDKVNESTANLKAFVNKVW